MNSEQTINVGDIFYADWFSCEDLCIVLSVGEDLYRPGEVSLCYNATVQKCEGYRNDFIIQQVNDLRRMAKEECEEMQ